MNLYSQFKKFRGPMERAIHRQEPRPVISSEAFSWVKEVESAHAQIKIETLETLKSLAQITNFDQVLPGQRALKQGDLWKSYYLTLMRNEIPEHHQACPETSKAIRKIPGLINAFFSILQPGTHVPPHRGPYNGILRYHLGIIIPRGDVAIRIARQEYQWQEGKSLIFDDSFEHEVWNRTKEARVVLFVDLVRPLAGPLDWLNRSVIELMNLSKEVKMAKKTVLENQIVRPKQESLSLK